MTEFRPGRFQVLPPVVKNLIIINVVVVIVQYMLGRVGINLADYLGLHYWKSYYFKPWQILTHMFMHGSPYDVGQTIIHIGSNMFGLWMFGRILENMWGGKRFLAFYLICGLGAALCHMAVLGYEFHTLEAAVNAFYHNPTPDQFARMLNENDWTGIPAFQNLSLHWQQDPGNDHFRATAFGYINQYLSGIHNVPSYVQPGLYDEVTVGASGAVFGVLFAFGYLFPNTELMIIPIPIPIKAKYLIGLYALFELYSGVKNSAGDNVAHFAHLGGMLVAFILLRIWNRTYRDRFY